MDIKKDRKMRCAKKLEEVAASFAYAALSEEEEQRFVKHLEQEGCEVCGKAISFALDFEDWLFANRKTILKKLNKELSTR